MEEESDDSDGRQEQNVEQEADSSTSEDEDDDENDELILLGIDEWLMLDNVVIQQDDSSSSEEEEGANEAVGFDNTLPITHSYLGEGMEELHGRTIHEANDIVKLPLVLLPGVTLVPNQIVPLHIFHPQSVSMMKRVLEADKTFGLINFHRPRREGNGDVWQRPESQKAAGVGTTAEIFSVKEDEKYGVVNLTMKAEGRQRFKVLETKRQIDGVLMGKVKILEDTQIPSLPSDFFVCNYKQKPSYLSSKIAHANWQASNYRFGTGSKISIEVFPKDICKTARTPLGPFPFWVYQQYNPFELMDRIMDEMREWNRTLETKVIPTDPNDFSHWLTANLPFDDAIRVSLLEVDCPITRLRRQLDLIQKCSLLHCYECGNPIADKKDLFSMSLKGPLAAYVNPGGYVHETVTFYKAKGLALRGRASSENSWFPGYAWTIAECRTCSNHMGWKFTVCQKGLTPSKFWGLARASLTPKYTS
ncbi:protein cereblon-like [Rhopilema esculentum]|uniref:protein cereblon-like n=1 Tax=Rhopilema esculentum TaxID=499914 RepID=UPI0031CF108C